MSKFQFLIITTLTCFDQRPLFSYFYQILSQKNANNYLARDCLFPDGTHLALCREKPVMIHQRDLLNTKKFECPPFEQNNLFSKP